MRSKLSEEEREEWCDIVYSHIAKGAEKGNLFLGGVDTIRKQVFKEYRIRAVLTVINSWAYNAHKIDEKLDKCEVNLNSRLHIPLADSKSADIESCFETAYEFICQQLLTENVLVHCQMGISRSASIVIYYMMKNKNLSYQDAFFMVQEKRPIIQPNFGFKQALIKAEADLNNRRVERQKQRESLEREEPEKSVIEEKRSAVKEESDKRAGICVRDVIFHQGDKSEKKNWDIAVSLGKGIGNKKAGSIYIGNIEALDSQQFSKGKQLSVLTVLDEEEEKRCRIMEKIKSRQISNHYWIKIAEHPRIDVKQEILNGVNWMNQQIGKTNILVQSKFGKSRSAAIIIGYYIVAFKLSFQASLQTICRSRPSILPKMKFIEALLEIDKQSNRN